MTSARRSRVEHFAGVVTIVVHIRDHLEATHGKYVCTGYCTKVVLQVFWLMPNRAAPVGDKYDFYGGSQVTASWASPMG